MIKFVHSGKWSHNQHIYFLPWKSSSSSYNIYSVGTTDEDLNLGTFCNSGTSSFSIYSQTGTGCENMNLGISGLTFTANYPYPNLLCTVVF